MANVSSLITLKSDLVKRKAEARSNAESKKSLDLYSFNKISRKSDKVPITCKKTIDITQKSNDLEFKNSITNLERKSQLYDKLIDNTSYDNDFLVDFSKKDKLLIEDEENFYTKVLNTEIRDHGTGYFKFSSDVSKRKEQMEELRKFQDEIIKEKSNLNKVQEIENLKLESRLQKIKTKYNVDVDHQDLLPKLQPAKDSEDTSIDTSVPVVIDDLLFEIRRNTKSKSKREWDRGKKTIFENIQKKIRKDRDTNFAPPAFY